MKTKTIITAILLLFSLTSFAQHKKELTKEETLTYINDLFKKSTGLTENINLDGKTLVRGSRRCYLMQNRSLEVRYNTAVYLVVSGNEEYPCLYAKTEEDAKRLKNALEHLIKLLKAEPETDPFAN